MRGEHERQLGCLSVLGNKHLPSTESREEEIAGHLLLFMKLQSILKLFCERFGMKGCEPKALANLFFRRSWMSWTNGSGGRKTIIFSNRAAIDQEARRRDQAQLRRRTEVMLIDRAGGEAIASSVNNQRQRSAEVSAPWRA
jgi:hypothetical protein